MPKDVFCLVQEKEDMDNFWNEVTNRAWLSDLVDNACFLVSLFADILSLSPRHLHFRPIDKSGVLTALFPFRFLQWETEEGSLLLRLRWNDRLEGVWMMINDFPPEDNPVYYEVAQCDRPSDAYLAVLPELYSQMPLVYNETVAFAPWIRILIDPSISFVARKEQIANYIQFAAQYNTGLPHFRGTEVTQNQRKDFMIFGYLPQKEVQYSTACLEAKLLSHPQTYLSLVVNTGMMLAFLGGTEKVLPEIPNGGNPQEYATVCALAGQVFVRLESGWETVMYNPYLFATLENMTLDQFFASSENIDCLRQVFAPCRCYLPNPDLV